MDLRIELLERIWNEFEQACGNVEEWSKKTGIKVVLTPDKQISQPALIQAVVEYVAPDWTWMLRRDGDRYELQLLERKNRERKPAERIPVDGEAVAGFLEQYLTLMKKYGLTIDRCPHCGKMVIKVVNEGDMERIVCDLVEVLGGHVC